LTIKLVSKEKEREEEEEISDSILTTEDMTVSLSEAT